MGKFEVYKDARGEYRFRLKADDGDNILASEGYSAKTSCMNGVESVKKNSQEAGRYERKTSANGKHFFNLKSSNGQVVGTSEMFATEEKMEHGIEQVKKYAPGATVEEV